MREATVGWNELTTLRAAKPFRPFFVEMRDGSTLEALGSLWFGGMADTFGLFDPRRGFRQYRRSDIAATRLMSDDEITDREPYLRRKRA